MRKDLDAASNNVIKVDFKERNLNAKGSLAAELQSTLDEDKYELCVRWLEKGTVCVLFDARPEAVKVPQEFKSRGDLRLNFSHDFLVPDFSLNRNAIWGTLSFDSGECFCSIPWQYVYGMQSADLKQGAVWFHNFPSDYDQVDVLGFDEEMVGRSSPEIEPSEQVCTEIDNVVVHDFLKKP